MSYWGHVIASFRMVLSTTNLAIFKWIFIIAMLCTAFVSKAGNDTQILIKFAAIDWCQTSYPVGFQQTCFFTLRQSNWQLSGVESSQRLEIGIAADTSIEVLNKFISENTHQFQIQPYVDRFIEQNAKKLLKKRIDTFVFTLNASVKELTRLGLSDQIRTAGCVNKENVYVAFSSHADLNEMVMRLSDRFDDVYPELLNSGWIDLIYQKYGIVSVSSIYEQLILIK